MANKQLNKVKVQARVDSTSNWNSTNPVLLQNEIGVEIVNTGTGEYKIKIGDGTKAWTALGYSTPYLDIDLSGYLPLTGGTLTGTLTLNGNPTSGLEAATKQYVDGLKVTVNNTLTSTSTTEALSAAQGKALNDKINALPTDVPEIKTFANVSVATSAFASDTTISQCPYKATITISGVDATYSPLVNFDTDIQFSGIQWVADCGANSLILYASAVPSANFVIPAVICTKVGA